MDKKLLSRGFRRHIREEKAKIRRSVLEPADQEKQLKELQESLKK